MIEKFVFSNKARNTAIAVSAIGLILVIIGIFYHDGQNVRFWANFLLSNFYFTAVSVTAVAWIAINYIANAGWHTALKRIPEAMSGYLPFGAAGMLILVGASFIGDHHNGLYAIYEWLHLDSEGFLHHHGEKVKDVVLQGKSGFLNLTFFLVRMTIIFALWITFRTLIRRFSLKEDAEGGLKNHNNSIKTSAVFIAVFALSFCLAGFDWLMSIEPHWYSTIYSVNIFAGAFVTTITIIMIIVVLMKRNGYMSYINDSHLHDLGKFMFGISIFWAYTWVSQFLLIWYANLPEETPYYLRRLQGGWKYVFFLNLFINFVTPLLALMTRNAKRSYTYLMSIGFILLCGRFIDWYLAIMPGSAANAHQAGFGFYEIGFFMFFGGIFAFVVGTKLTKANLVPVNHPYLEESLHHEI
ncbi:MAG: quinol:cytochrome C oxidoreductase [Bacteroidia bacterium]